MDFFVDHAVLFALLCAASGGAVRALPDLLAAVADRRATSGCARSRGAVQEGAAAYLRKQYTTIAVVAVAPFLLIGFYSKLGWGTAFGFVIGATLSAAAGFIGMNVAVRSNSRTAEAAREGVGPAFKVAFRAGSVTGLLVVGLGMLGVAGYYWILTGWLGNSPGVGGRRSDRARVRRLADLGVRASRRRHLHEGRRCRRRPRRQDRGRYPGGRPAQPGRDRRQRGRQRRRLRRHGRRPVRDVRRHRRRRDAARHALPGREALAVPALARWRLDRRLDHRHVLRPRRSRARTRSSTRSTRA